MPSYLQGVLQQRVGSQCKVRVTNYGHRFFYSSQEVVLLSQLLKWRKHPDAVVFLDGLNDCGVLMYGKDMPVFSNNLATMWNAQQIPKEGLAQYEWIPMVRLAFTLRHGLIDSAAAQPLTAPEPPIAETCGNVLQNYRGNMEEARSLCHGLGIDFYAFWQPVPLYHFDRRQHAQSGRCRGSSPACLQRLLRCDAPGSAED